jgi:hypothetical protein
MCESHGTGMYPSRSKDLVCMPDTRTPRSADRVPARSAMKPLGSPVVGYRT